MGKKDFKINSNYMKAILSSYFRFKRQHPLIATEVGRFNADFIAVKKRLVTEVEIKTSKADFKADFKKKKHQIYEHGKSYSIPNKFYFAVPEKLAEFAMAQLIGSNYGLIIVASPDPKRRIKQVNYSDIFDVRHKSIEEKANAHAKMSFYKNKNPKVTIISRSMAQIEYDVSLPTKDRCMVAKKAKSLHDKTIDSRFLHQIIARLSSEMANLRLNSILKS